MIPQRCSAAFRATGLVLVCTTLASGAIAASLVSERAASCIESAALYHRVNDKILTAIVIHESLGRASTVSRNKNGSIDVGLTGINSIHFRELQQKGVRPEQLLDECVSVYVGAWTYSKKVFKYGNTWQAVGAYHSETPVNSQRYQALIYNTMVRAGMLSASGLAVETIQGGR